MGRTSGREYEFSRETRNAAFARSKGHCEGCGTKFEGTIYPHAHHRIPLKFLQAFPASIQPYLESVVNCRMLCRECHRIEDEKVLKMTPEQVIAFASEVVFAGLELHLPVVHTKNVPEDTILHLPA